MAPDISFPQEIVDYFVECLAINPPDKSLKSRYALTSCTLVSKSFSAPARRHLFSTISLTPKKTRTSNITTFTVMRPPHEIMRRMQDLAELLARDAFSMALLVRTLHIEIDEKLIMLRQESGLSAILGLLSSGGCVNLSSFHFGVSSELSPLNWTTIGVEISESLATICRLQSIKRLSFENFVLPTELILVCPSLEAMRLRRTKFSDSTASDSPPTMMSPLLESLDVESDIVNFAELAFMGPMISKIKYLGLSVFNEKEIPAFIKILSRASNKLDSLNVHLFGPKCESLAGSMSHPLLPSLRNIVFRLELAAPGALPTAKHLVNFLTHPNISRQVQTITLGFRVLSLVNQLARFVPAEDEGFRWLGSSVIENKFPRLQKVTFKLDVELVCMQSDPTLSASVIQEMEESLQAQIMALIIPSSQSNSNGRIEVKVTVFVLKYGQI